MTRIAGPTRSQLDQAADQYAALLDRELAHAVERTVAWLGDQFDADDLGVLPKFWADRLDDLLAPTLALALHAGSADIRRQLRRHLGLTAGADEKFHLPGKHDQQTHGHDNLGGDLTPDLRKHLPPEDADRVGRLLGTLSERYGVGFDKVDSVPSSRIDQDIADVYGGKLRVNRRLLSDRVLAKADQQGWLAPGTGTVEGLITHEYAHRLLDDPSHGRASLATVAQTRARLRADAAGAPRPQAVSDYAQSAGEEVTAELFAHYHWGGARRPPWVVTWGEALHQELGVDPTPLSEVG